MPTPAARAVGAATGLCVAVFAAWHALRTGTVDLGALAFFTALTATTVMAGRMVTARLAARDPAAGDLPAVLLTGTLAVELGLLALKSLPLPPTVAPCLLFVIVTAAFVGDPGWRARRLEVGGWPLATIAVALAAATLWSGSSLHAVVIEGDAVLFRPWTDAFYHSSWIRAAAWSDGLWTSGHNLLADGGAEFYSFGDYLLPGELTALTGTRAYDAANCFWTPLGLFLSGLAAHLLARSWWGPRAGFAAATAVLCAPDAASYFLRNEYFGYHWLQVVGPGGAWGTATAALCVWAVGQWCRSGQRLAGALAMGAAALTFLCKAQIFLALAPLVVVMKVACLRRWSLRARLLGLGAFVALALLGPLLAEAMMPGLGLRLDGSGAKPYLMSLPTHHQGAWRALAGTVTETSSSWSDALFGGAYLLLATFGPILLLVVGVGLLWQWRTRTLAAASLVVVTVPAVYLVMTLGLSVNATGKHTPDALVHRPFVWAWFVLTTWAAGFLVDRLGRLSWPRTAARVGAVAAALLVAGLLAFVGAAGHDGHRGPWWSGKYSEQRVDRGLVECAGYLRLHSPVGAIVQDSREDPILLVVALSERRCYLTSSHLVTGAIADREERAARLAALRAATDGAEIARLAAQLGIDWFVLHPGDDVAWPAAVLDRAPFAAGGYRVVPLR